MEHGKKNRKFSRETKQRSALMRSLANALISHGRIVTSEAKAKSLKVYVEKLITKSKRIDLTNKRLLTSEIGPKSADKLIKEIGPRFKDRHGGYTKVIKITPRISDSARMSIIEFLK